MILHDFERKVFEEKNEDFTAFLVCDVRGSEHKQMDTYINDHVWRDLEADAFARQRLVRTNELLRNRQGIRVLREIIRN